jgi:hypothetical protein
VVWNRIKIATQISIDYFPVPFKALEAASRKTVAIRTGTTSTSPPQRSPQRRDTWQQFNTRGLPMRNCSISWLGKLTALVRRGPGEAELIFLDTDEEKSFLPGAM